MSNLKDIERLARFLGWNPDEPGQIPSIERLAWNPFERIEDAMMLVHKIIGVREHTFELFCDSDGDWMAKFDKVGEYRHWLNLDGSDVAQWAGCDGHKPEPAIAKAAKAWLDAREKTAP